MTLTIAIPTYNRRGDLERLLERLAGQLNGQCDLLILDNASDSRLEDLACSMGGTGARVELIRHTHNIGAHANIHRAIELAGGEWLWVLGDDDLPTVDAVSRILEGISRDPDASYINFVNGAVHRRGTRVRVSRATGLAEFANALDLPDLLNFMSSSVWRVETMRPHLRLAYHYAYSMSWVFAFLFPMLSEGATVVLRPDAIIEHMSLAAEETRWSRVDFIRGYPTVLESPMPSDIRQKLASKLLIGLGPEKVVAYLLAGVQGQSRAHSRWVYRTVVGRLAPYYNASQRVRMVLYGRFFVFPRLSWMVVRQMILLSVKLGWKGVQLADLEKRGQAGDRL